MVSWADAQESDEEMVGTDETSKRQKVEVIEAALQVVNEECTENCSLAGKMKRSI